MIHTELIEPVGALLRRHATERPTKVAFEDARQAMTYAELERSTANLASHLQDHGAEPGDKVALLLPNCVAWVASCLATVRAGCVSVPISHDATEAEIRYRLEDAGCKAIVCSAQHVELVQKLQRELPGLKTIYAASADVPTAGVLALVPQLASPGEAEPRDSGDLDATAFIVYTSGTTGRAKGVMLTQRSMLWVVAACWAPIANLSDKDVVLSPLPLFHSYALNLCVLGVIAVGATEYILERYSTQEVVAQLKTGRYTLMPAVPTMFHYLLEACRGKEHFEAAGIRRFISAGAIMPSSLNREFEAYFGVELLDGYGITETSTMVTMNWPGTARPLGSCGLPVPGLAVRLVSLDGKDVPIGEEGELIVRGPNLMQGYLNKPAETAAALVDGWYRTGDLARSDPNGFLTITGRLKELIIRGGQNIAPGEVEEAVLSFPDVLDCAALGMPHKHLGEVPVICVVARDGRQIDPDSIKQHCAVLLSSYKVPQSVHVVSAIPRTGSGKVMRFKLKEQLAADVQLLVEKQ
ncbi:class I adenylate-forming enzyme family protein [Ramlibacter sp. WS9]|uniref:class I adenylate-forming enzyme family protein n=1 Tax=Ramlibacter sp. WS9 TaxID=1882741 RepID=UPI001143FA36|nr:AMP-binding protein [Ramlibacter sp. WS9]ROZ68765.1 long-chain fatty acid--CoA ligase [Ramlibacter sp. WS9]